MSAGAYNFVIEQGATFDRLFTYKADGTNPTNLTGYTARMQIRVTHDAPVAILSLTSPTNITLGGAAGTLRVVITDEVTAALAAGSYVYDLEIEDAAGAVTRLLKGEVEVDPEVTR